MKHELHFLLSLHTQSRLCWPWIVLPHNVGIFVRETDAIERIYDRFSVPR